MSYTILYLMTESLVKETAEKLEAVAASRELWHAYLSHAWEGGEKHYPYDAFVKHSAAREGAKESYYLAHTLKDGCSARFSLGVELDQLVFEWYWVPETLPNTLGPAADALLATKRRVGVRSRSNRRVGINPFTDQPRDLPPLRPGHNPMSSDDDLRRGFANTDLPETAATDLILMNRLCNRSNRRPPDPAMRYPMWAFGNGLELTLSAHQRLRPSQLTPVFGRPGANGPEPAMHRGAIHA